MWRVLWKCWCHEREKTKHSDLLDRSPFTYGPARPNCDECDKRMVMAQVIDLRAKR